MQAKGRPRSRTACESGVSEDAFFRRPSASPFVTSYTEEGGKNEAKSTRTTFSKPLTRLCPVSVEGKPNCSFFFFLSPPSNLPRSEDRGTAGASPALCSHPPHAPSPQRHVPTASLGGPRSGARPTGRRGSDSLDTQSGLASLFCISYRMAALCLHLGQENR